MSTNFIMKIKSVYPQLTKSERKVADFILTNAKEGLYLSITELAQACKVGDASVYRFCRSIGLKGYQEFKVRLSLSLNDDTSQDLNEKIEDGFKANANTILKRYTTALTETLMLMSEEHLLEIVQKIKQAECVYFFGLGNSGLTAIDARNKFNRITNKVQCVNDTHLQAMLANIMGEKDLIIFISYSGETQENIDIAKIAKNAGAKVACITRYEDSPLAQYADNLLLCGAYENPMHGGGIEVRISQMYVIDLIFQAYYLRNKEESTVANSKTTSAIVETLY